MKLILLASLALALSACSGNEGSPGPGNQQAETPEIKNTVAEARDFLLEGRKITLEQVQAIRKQGATRGIKPIPWILYEWIECSASWDQTCNGKYKLTAPANWQVCNVLFNIVHQDGPDRWVNTAPSDWYTNDPMSPDRFRTIDLHIHAGGSHTFFPQKGSEIRITDVGVSILESTASNNDRFDAGCTMPAHD